MRTKSHIDTTTFIVYHSSQYDDEFRELVCDLGVAKLYVGQKRSSQSAMRML
jgi:hypothetical protein